MVIVSGSKQNFRPAACMIQLNIDKLWKARCCLWNSRHFTKSLISLCSWNGNCIVAHRGIISQVSCWKDLTNGVLQGCEFGQSLFTSLTQVMGLKKNPHKFPHVARIGEVMSSGNSNIVIKKSIWWYEWIHFWQQVFTASKCKAIDLGCIRESMSTSLNCALTYPSPTYQQQELLGTHIPPRQPLHSKNNSLQCLPASRSFHYLSAGWFTLNKSSSLYCQLMSANWQDWRGVGIFPCLREMRGTV